MKYKLINSVTKIETICEKVTIDGFDYYVSDEKIHFGYVWNTILEQVETMFKEKTFHDDLKGIISTNNPNIDIPKVVDEVEKLALEYENSFTNGEGNADVDFKAGYNKSQETHPNSDEDMIKFGIWLHDTAFATYQVDGEYIRMWHIHYPDFTYVTSKELLQLWKEQQPKIVYYE